MMKLREAIALAICILFVGCDRETGDHRIIPNGFKDFLPEAHDRSPVIDCDSLYKVTCPNVMDSTYVMRFWENGRFLLKPFVTVLPPTQKGGPPNIIRNPRGLDGDDFTGGYVGKYCVSGGKLYMAYYAPDEYSWSYYTEEAMVFSVDQLYIYRLIDHGPSIIFTQDHSRVLNCPIERLSVDKKMLRDPDW